MKIKFLLLLLCLFFTSCQSIGEKQYKKGYSIGHYNGYQEGKSEGYQEGKSEGYQEGYLDGTKLFISKKLTPTVAFFVLILTLMILAFVFFKYIKTPLFGFINIFLQNHEIKILDKKIKQNSENNIKIDKENAKLKAKVESIKEAQKHQDVINEEIIKNKIKNLIFNELQKYLEAKYNNIEHLTQEVINSNLSNEDKINNLKKINNYLKN